MAIFKRPEITFADSVKLKDTKTDSWQGNLVKVFEENTTLFTDLPVRASSELFEDRGKFRSGYKRNKFSALSNIDKGGITGSIETYDRKDVMAQREAWITVTQKQEMLDPDVGRYADILQSETVTAMALDAEHDIIYANPKQNPDAPLGLAPRFCTITDYKGVIQGGAGVGRLSPYITLDASYTIKGGEHNGKNSSDQFDGELGSCYMLSPSAQNGACLIYPKNLGGGASVIMKEYNNIVVENGTDDKENTVKSKRQFMMWYGLAIMKPRQVVRIANIDYKTPEGIKAFIRQLRFANLALAPDVRNSAICYVPDVLFPYLEEYWEGKVNPTTYADAKPHNFNLDKTIGQYNLRPIFQLSANEGKVTTAKAIPLYQ